jgi:hypothetical protein
MFVSSDAESHAQRRLADALPILVMIFDADGALWEAPTHTPDPAAIVDAMEQALMDEAPGVLVTALSITTSLDKVDHIVFYTDGILEGGKDALDGSQRLSEALSALTIFDPHPSLTLLSATEQTFRDDAAIVVARIDVID